jgi:hypothetical protein
MVGRRIESRLAFGVEQSAGIGCPLNISHFPSTKLVTVRQHGGSSLLVRHGNVLERALTRAFPEYQWAFDDCPKDYWDDPHNVTLYMKWLGDKLKAIYYHIIGYKLAFLMK